MRKIQPFTIGTKLSVPPHHDHTPDLHLSTPSVTSQPGSSPAPPCMLRHKEEEEEEEEEEELLSQSFSSRSVRKITICREEAVHAGRSPSPAQEEVTLSEEEETMKSTSEHLSQQEVDLALEVSLFYQRADIILSDISRTLALSQSEDTRHHLHKNEASSASSEQIDEIAADITVLDRCVHHLSELHPTLTARVRRKQKEVKTCWALLLQQHSMKEPDSPEALNSQFGHGQEVLGLQSRPEPGLGIGIRPEPQLSGLGPGLGPSCCTTLNKQSERQTAEEEEKEEESSVTLTGEFTTVRCDKPPDHCAGVTSLASSISVFLTFDTQMKGSQSQEPAESQLTLPPHLMSRCVQVTGESRETFCYNDMSSGDDSSISSSTTTFLPRVSTVVLPPSLSILTLQPTVDRRRGSTHQQTISKIVGNEEEVEGEGHGNSAVTMETEDAKGRPAITLGGDDTQVRGDSGKSCCCCVSPGFTNVSNFKSKQSTVSKVQQPPEDNSSSFSSSSISSGLQRPQDQNQQVNLSSNFIRKTVNENSETYEAKDQLNLPGVSSESLSSPEGEGLFSTAREGVSYFMPKEDTGYSVSPPTILYDLHQTLEQNQEIHFSSSTLQKTFSENVETKDIENQVKPQDVSLESSFTLNQEEGGLTLTLDLLSDHKAISHVRSKEDSPINALSNQNQTQDQKQRAGVSLNTIRENLEFRYTKNQEALPGVSSMSSSSLPPKEEGLMLKFDPLQDCKDVSNSRCKEDTSSSINPTIISPYLQTAPAHNQQADMSSRTTRKTFMDNSVTSVLLSEEGLAPRFDKDIIRSREHNQLNLINSFLSGLHQTQDQNQQADILSSLISKTFTDKSETKETEDQVRLPCVFLESSSALHQEHGELAPHFDKSQDGEGVLLFRSKEDASSSIIPATASLDLHRPQDQKLQVDLLSSTNKKSFADNSETRKTPDEIKHPGIAVSSSSSLFPEDEGCVLRFDFSSSIIREAFNKNSDTKDTEDHVKPPGVSLESPCSVFPEEEHNIHGDLSILPPPAHSTAVQEDQGIENNLIIQEGTFIQKTETDSFHPQQVDHQHHCLSVHTKTCYLRGHIYQPITGLLSTQRVDGCSASMSLRPGLRRSGRVFECLAEGCCICSPGLKNTQETESNHRPDPVRSDRRLFDEVEVELENIWRQTAP